MIKFKLGQELFTIKDCKVVKGNVEEIIIKKDKVTYHISGDEYAIRDESQVFTSRKELIEQL